MKTNLVSLFNFVVADEKSSLCQKQEDRQDSASVGEAGDWQPPQGGDRAPQKACFVIAILPR